MFCRGKLIIVEGERLGNYNPAWSLLPSVGGKTREWSEPDWRVAYLYKRKDEVFQE